MFWKKWIRTEEVEFFDYGQLEDKAIEITERMLDGKKVDIKRRKIIWAADRRLTIEECAAKIYDSISTDEPITVDMVENAITGWLECGEYYPRNLTEDQESDLDDLVWQWIEDFRDAAE